MKPLLIVILCWTALSLRADEPVQPFACLPESAFRLGGIVFDQTSRSVHARLGRPRSVSKVEGEDDGGLYDIRSEAYDGIVVNFGRGDVVESVLATSPKFVLRAGSVHVGMTATQVAKRLHFTLQGFDAKLRLPICSLYEDQEILLTFRGNGVGDAILIEIGMGSYGP